VKAFISSLAASGILAPMLLSLMGLRPAEVCGLRWPDIDLDVGTLRVENTRTLVAVDGPLVVVEKTTKRVSGRRSLPLPAPVVTAMRTFKACQAAEKLAAGPAYRDTGYVLVNELGFHAAIGHT
jgi:integrase